MYLTSVYILLNLDTEVSAFDRERVLRSLRERLKNTFGHSITVRTDTDSAIAVVFLEDSLERTAKKTDAVLARLEEAGEARILSTQTQVFAWQEGEFRELIHERNTDDAQDAQAGRSTTFEDDYDHIFDNANDELLGGVVKRQSRRGLRIPVRK